MGADLRKPHGRARDHRQRQRAAQDLAAALAEGGVDLNHRGAPPGQPDLKIDVPASPAVKHGSQAGAGRYSE
jgi:hypothetical protein